MTSTVRVQRFFRTPKGQLIAILGGLLVIAGRVEGFAHVGPGLVGAIVTALVLDVPLLRWRRGRWAFPDGALLSALLIGAVLGPRNHWMIAAGASAVAILSKHVLRNRSANVFNPAALGLVVVALVSDSSLSWWGAVLRIVPFAAWPLLAGSAVWVAARVHRLPLVVSFLASYFVLFAAATFFVEPREVAEIFVAPDLLAMVFFAGFMLTDPPTSPPRAEMQVVIGSVVAIASATVFLTTGAAHFLLSGVLCGNLVEGVRRAADARRRLRGS